VALGDGARENDIGLDRVDAFFERPVTSHLPIETPRLVLRDLADEDGPAVHAYAHDAAVVRYLDWGPNTADDTTQFLAMARSAREAVPRTAYYLAIVLGATTRLIGGCRIEIRSAASGNGDIGYVLARDAWGHGYATEASRALLAFGFETLALHRIWATCDVQNQTSARVLEKLGMRQEARLRENVRRRGEWRDSYLYAILQSEWR
jgi:RimJ/RimL family protein N-acetyltransferase